MGLGINVPGVRGKENDMASRVNVSEGKLQDDDGRAINLDLSDVALSPATLAVSTSVALLGGAGLTAANRPTITQTYSTAGTVIPAPPADITGGESPTEAEFNALNAQVLALTKLVVTLVQRDVLLGSAA